MFDTRNQAESPSDSVDRAAGNQKKKLIYEVGHDFETCADQWFFDEPRAKSGEEIDARQFTEGRPYYGQTPVILPVSHSGRSVPFSLGPFEMPVVSEAIANVIRRFAATDVELLPVAVPGIATPYAILNALPLLDCLDEQRSEFTRYEKQGPRPDLAGEYHTISTICIDVKRTENHHLFRIKGWPVVLFVSDTIKEALEGIPLLGVTFTLVGS